MHTTSLLPNIEHWTYTGNKTFLPYELEGRVGVEEKKDEEGNDEEEEDGKE